MSRFPAPSELGAAALLATSLAVVGTSVPACKAETNVELWVDGFEPSNVRFEVEDQGALDRTALLELTRRKDIDGSLLLPEGSCSGPCRVSVVSVFVHNRGDAEAPPVVRLKSPPGRPRRQPIAFRGGEISKGRVGRIRWVVEMWPEEERLTTTVSSSVFLVEQPASAAPAAAPASAPAPATSPSSSPSSSSSSSTAPPSVSPSSTAGQPAPVASPFPG